MARTLGDLDEAQLIARLARPFTARSRRIRIGVAAEHGGKIIREERHKRAIYDLGEADRVRVIRIATRRRRGLSCSAIYTTPQPPSPICWSSL